HTSQHMPR
ncbi:hypothetical protein EE612_059236, partial [Oryza sativa]